MPVAFEPQEAFVSGRTESYTLLPFRFARVPGLPNRVLVTSEAGEYLFLSQSDFDALTRGSLPDSDLLRDLEARQIICRGELRTAVRIASTKLRTKKTFLREGPGLHIFVVSLRCDHSCHYCQVSRQVVGQSKFDMSLETATAAIDRVFESPARELTIEFQGGEPLLAFDVIRHVVETVLRRNETENRSITFTITSTLHHATNDVLEFFKQHDFQVSVSLDGPAEIHNQNRPLHSRDSYERTIERIEAARLVLGHNAVSALTTLTQRSLGDPKAIVDEYVRLGFRSIFLRPLSPFGFAVRSQRRIGYPMSAFVTFYEEALDHILELNKSGTHIEEAYTSILLTHILTPFASRYVDLRSPAGAGFGVLVYNYDGGVYASDESRMLAEMNDETFRLGDVRQPYAELMRSTAMEVLTAAGTAEALPGCSDCAYLPYCGADPVQSLAVEGDPVGHRAFSSHCKRHMGMFDTIFRHLAGGCPTTMRTFLAWVMHRAPEPGEEVA